MADLPQVFQQTVRQSFPNIGEGINMIGQLRLQQQLQAQQAEQELQNKLLVAQLEEEIKNQNRVKMFQQFQAQFGGQPGFNDVPRETSLPRPQSSQEAAMSLATGGVADVGGRRLSQGFGKFEQPVSSENSMESSLQSRPFLMSPEGRVIQNPYFVSPLERRKESREQQKFSEKQKVNEETAQARVDLLKNSASSALKTIDEIEGGLEYFGAFGGLPSFPGTSRSNWEANINKLLAEQVLKVLSDLKSVSKTGATGFGQLSNKELKILQDSSTALKRTLSQEDAKRYLQDIRSSFSKILGGEKNEQAGNSEYEAYLEAIK